LLKGIPEDILREIQKIKDMFAVDRETLKRVTDKFSEELAKGISTPARMKSIVGETNSSCRVVISRK
jgi:hexokinase